MKEGSLAAVCAMTAVVGIALLLVLARSVEPERLSVDELSGDDLGKYVVIKARVHSVADFSEGVRIKVCSKYCLNVVVWKYVAREMEEKSLSLSGLRRGQVVEAEGVVREWNNAFELVVRDWRAIEVIG